MDNLATTNPEFARVAFDDADVFADFVKELDWALESTQLSTGPYRLEFETFVFPELSVSRLTTRQSLYDRFAVPDGAAVFSIPRSKLPAIWNGRRLPPSMTGIYQPGIDHWVVLPAGWDGYEFTVSERMMRRLGLFPEHLFKKDRQFKYDCIPLMEPVTGAFVTQLDTLFRLARNDQAHEVPSASTSPLFDIVVQGLLEIVDAGLGDEDKHRLTGARRSDVVRKATDLVEARLESQLTVQDLVSELGESARVLNYAFKDNLGVSPYRYIQMRKLKAVRWDLKSSDEPIVEIISRYGFGTASRFARQYQRAFGEMPSSTRNGRR